MPLSRLMLSAALLAALSAAAAAKPVTLSAETNLRKAPGTKSEAIGLMPKGTEVEVGECDSGWCKVTWDGQEGYAIARNLGMVVPGAPREANVTRPAQQPADMSRLRRGYEQYFDDQSRAADQNADPRQRQYNERQYGERQYSERQYAERRVAPPRVYEDDDDGVVYGAPQPPYVAVAPRAYYYAGPPVYYGPRVYYGWGRGPYYYRRW
jgi:uncharacterized protein YraI